MPRKNDLTGMKFNRLKAIKPIGIRNGEIVWRFECDCKNTIDVIGSRVKNGYIKSCGCLATDVNRTMRITHGYSKTKLYVVWQSMKRRCLDEKYPKYKDYGSRGITVCDEWLEFENFKKWSDDSGYKEGLTIDRIDNDKGYFPDNCQWITNEEQQLNKRNNRIITFNGKSQTISEWARELNINEQTLRNRLQKENVDIEKALTTPVNKNLSRRTSK